MLTKIFLVSVLNQIQSSFARIILPNLVSSGLMKKIKIKEFQGLKKKEIIKRSGRFMS